MRIVNVGYRSVNRYLLVTERANLLIDSGWPGGMPELKRSMAANGLSVKDITHLIMTHYHIDHAGIAQEIKDKGAKLIVMENQQGHLNDLRQFLHPPMVFHDITESGNINLKFKDTREYLRDIGIDGEIVPTTSHCPDHVTLILEGGAAFTGDLLLLNASEEGSEAWIDWQRLLSMRMKKIYPAHGPAGLDLS